MRKTPSLFINRLTGLMPLLLALTISMAGCHSRKTAVVASPGYTSSSSSSSSNLKPSQIASQAATSHESDATKRLMTEADKWLGTPYRYGGHTRGKGADCSGFVSQVFLDALSIKLPRTSREQQQWCSNLRGGRRDLLPGDLVFFITGKGKGVNHVGIYIGNGKMIHSSTSRGVIVSDLDEKYYTNTYHSSGRVEPYYAMTSTKPKGSGSNSTKSRKEQPSISLEDLAQVSAPTVSEPSETKANATLNTAAEKTTVPVKQSPVSAAPAKTEPKPQSVLKTVVQKPDTALSADEARRRLLMRLETDSIR